MRLNRVDTSIRLITIGVRLAIASNTLISIILDSIAGSARV